jgi:hypothetical protein
MPATNNYQLNRFPVHTYSKDVSSMLSSTTRPTALAFIRSNATVWTEMTEQFSPDSVPSRKRRSQMSQAARTTQSADYYSSQDWGHLRAVILKALQDFPEARESVVDALRTLNATKDSDDASS